MKKILLSLLLVFTLLTNQSCTQPAKPYTFSREEIKTIRTIDQVIDTVVEIEAFRFETGLSIRLGAGIIVSPDGLIITAAHVVDQSESIVVTLRNGKSYPAKIHFKHDQGRDLSLLKIESDEPLNLPCVRFAPNYYVGQNALLIGHPVGLKWSVSKGIVSAIREETLGPNLIIHLALQIDSKANKGNSGGGVFNSKRECLGIISFIKGDKDKIGDIFSFIISAKDIQDFLNE